MADLIFDIGMHNGNDTAYYLANGYDVVAVEANPEFCAAARKRFETEVEVGRLTICNVGIADEQNGELEFWVSDQSEWSSFHKEQATMSGVSASSIMVPTTRFADLLNQFAPAFYAKVDIERNDTLCVRDLERCASLPRYVSFEGHDDAVADVRLLAKLGYQDFKCVRQTDWREITSDNMHWQGRMRKLLAMVDSNRATLKLFQRLHYRKPSRKGWRFEGGSSGPLAFELEGRWMTADEMVDVWEYCLALDQELNAGGLGEWFDIHAARR